MSSVRGPSLRDQLRVATATFHQTLDKAVSPYALGSRDEYAQFLSFQYAARRPIEAWVGVTVHDCPPPQVCDLIAADLAELECEVPAGLPEFGLPPGADALGLFWVLAGSSLGNRMILQNRDDDAAMRFLSDKSMVEYWNLLRPRLQVPATVEEAASAASAAIHTFRHFIAHAPSRTHREAA